MLGIACREVIFNCVYLSVKHYTLLFGGEVTYRFASLHTAAVLEMMAIITRRGLRSGAAKVVLSPESCILLRKHETLHKCSMVPNYYLKK